MTEPLSFNPPGRSEALLGLLASRLSTEGSGPSDSAEV
jgi:hypothetical protein